VKGGSEARNSRLDVAGPEPSTFYPPLRQRLRALLIRANRGAFAAAAHLAEPEGRFCRGPSRLTLSNVVQDLAPMENTSDWPDLEITFLREKIEATRRGENHSHVRGGRDRRRISILNLSIRQPDLRAPDTSMCIGVGRVADKRRNRLVKTSPQVKPLERIERRACARRPGCPLIRPLDPLAGAGRSGCGPGQPRPAGSVQSFSLSFVDYSARSASTGFRRVARRAGMKVAMSATANSTMAVASSVGGSLAAIRGIEAASARLSA
jgi:hypothetical protein